MITNNAIITRVRQFAGGDGRKWAEVSFLFTDGEAQTSFMSEENMAKLGITPVSVVNVPVEPDAYVVLDQKSKRVLVYEQV